LLFWGFGNEKNEVYIEFSFLSSLKKRNAEKYKQKRQTQNVFVFFG